MKRRNMLHDELVEFKPRYKGAVYGVRNGAWRAYVFDSGKDTPAWEHRYTVDVMASGEPVGSYWGSNDLEEAKKRARHAVSGRAMRHMLRRM